jgi:Skp family chaperone for outer membrane proteins
VKRTVAIVAGVLSLGLALYVGKVWAQTTPARPAGAPQTRVGLLNIRYVVKHYDKYKSFMDQMEEEDRKFTELMKGKQAQAEQIKKQLEKATGAEKENLEQQMRAIQRDAQDLTEKARREVAKRGNDEMVKVYKEIRDAAYRHAQSHNYDIVLHFEGAADNNERDNPMLITRNMNAGGAVPLYWNPQLDISAHVLHALNTAYRNAGTKKPG